MPEPQPPSPVLLFETINAYQRTAAIRAAIELSLFTAIGEGNTTVEALAARCRAAERGVRILADYLVIGGFLLKRGDQYALTPDAAVFLDERSPAYMGGAVEFLLSPMLTDGFRDLTEAVRQGGTALSPEGTMAPEHPVWVQFARAMKPMMELPARAIAEMVPWDPQQPLRVLDLAAGHGLFGIALAERYPRTEIVAVDWPQVLEVARENALRAGVADRYRLLPGSAFEVDFDGTYDVVLLTNFLHHFDPLTCEGMLRKVHAALAEGGLAVTLEFVPAEDRVSPPAAAGFSLTMLASTRSGDAYTFAELDQMFRRAGFSATEGRAVPNSVETVLLSRR